MWDEQAKELGRSFRILRYDQRGHGKTDAPAGRYSFDTLVADAVALLDALSIKRAHFAGLSMGGATALGLALRHPGPVRPHHRLQLAVPFDAGLDRSNGRSASRSPPRRAWRRWSSRRSRAGSRRRSLAAKPPYLDKVRQMIRTTPLDGFVGCGAALANHDFRSQVASVTRPVLFIVGEKDGTTPPVMRQMHAELPGSKFVELPGAGHISNMDQPARFTGAIREFLT